MSLSPSGQQRRACRAALTCVRYRFSPLRDEGGAVTAELVIIMPALLTMILLLAQATIWWHATHIAQATASDALSVTRVQDGTAAAGKHEAQHVLGQLGRGPLRGAQVTVTRTADHAEVEVIGTASSVVPFLHLPVHAHASGPVERFRPGTQVVLP
ncbi:TadE/TadG family type IV pilus assembly protein [Streptomyces sp. NPDC090075]|uniref:TadE/TadG family type IV pilus assembly protein n=1 Tax=Streptomyces sp. NPDC090075 TaxID=3365937 RepID=UPI00381F3E97